MRGVGGSGMMFLSKLVPLKIKIVFFEIFAHTSISDLQVGQVFVGTPCIIHNVWVALFPNHLRVFNDNNLFLCISILTA